MNLLRTGLATSVGVVIRMLSGLVLGKVLAVSVGPSGFAVIGQFQNLMSVVQTFAAGALGQGVTKYTAEDTDSEHRFRLWRTAGLLSLIGSGLMSLVLILFSERIAEAVLFGKGDRGVIIMLAVSLLPISLNGLLLAVLNGLKEVRLFVLAGIAGSLTTMLFTSIAAWQFGIFGALVAVASNQAVAFLATLILCWRQPWFRISHFFGRLNIPVARNLGAFVLMAFTTSLTVPVGQFILRNIIVNEFGLESAGYWEAVNRLSVIYLTFFISVFSVYLLPKLAETTSILQAISVSRYLLKFVVPISLLLFSFIFIIKDFIIKILFDESFDSASKLFLFQLFGDFFKIISWIFSYIMIGKAMTKSFIVLEIVFSITLILISMFIMNNYGFFGVSAAYALNYFLYGIAVIFVLRVHVARELVKQSIQE